MPTDTEDQQAHPLPATFEYRLQRTPVGVVLLDADLSIRSLNPVARRLLAPAHASLFGANILDIHPDEAREKVAWLITRAGTAADGTSSLVVTTAAGSLIAKVSRLDGNADGTIAGYCMMVHALSDAPAMGRSTTADLNSNAPQVDGLPVAATTMTSALCPLMKLPLVRGRGVSLIDVADVVCLVAQGHYAEAKTLSSSALCPRSLADLERRLDPTAFLRIHRRYVINIRHVRGAERVDGGWQLILDDQAATRVPVSRTKVEAVRRLLAV